MDNDNGNATRRATSINDLNEDVRYHLVNVAAEHAADCNIVDDEQKDRWMTLRALASTNHAHSAAFHNVMDDLGRQKVCMACGHEDDVYYNVDQSVVRRRDLNPFEDCSSCEQKFLADMFDIYRDGYDYPDDAPDGTWQTWQNVYWTEGIEIWRGMENGVWRYWME